MTKSKEVLSNADAIEELKKQIEVYTKTIQENNTRLLKAQGAIEVLEQIEEGVEKSNDSEATD